MVEIPEHLLKRSKERRAALGLGGGEASSGAGAGEAESTPAAASPAPAAPSKPPPPPEPKAPEPPKPDPVYIQAAKQRHRLPWWSVPVFAFTPLWAVFFARTLSPPAEEGDPLTLGGEIYQSCAGCHGADGSGGGGFPELTAVGETFPDFRDHLMWVRTGSQDWPAETYGTDDAPNSRGMPSFATLTDEELAQVVLYERQQFGQVEDTGEEIGTSPDGEPITEEHLLMIAEGELTFADVGLGPLSEEAGLTEDDIAG